MIRLAGRLGGSIPVTVLCYGASALTLPVVRFARKPHPASLTKNMSWKKSKFASSLMSLFGESVPDLNHESRIKDIRQAMLDCLSGLGESHELARVWARILYAADIQALWYLRAEVMTLLAGLLGETAAHSHLASITNMFNGLLPAAQRSRPNRLRQ